MKRFLPIQIIDRINNYPTVLVLGQNTRKVLNGEDYLLKKVCLKYHNNKVISLNYNIILNSEISEASKEYFFSWLSDVADNIISPDYLETLRKVQFAHIYTSLIDQSIESIFSSAERIIIPIYNSDVKIANLRDKSRLHVSYLFGCVNQVENGNIPPTNQLEKIKRFEIARTMFRDLPSIVTTSGLVLIDGYDFENDWLSLDLLYATLSNLSVNQCVIFSAEEKWSTNDRVKDLIDREKIVLVESSLVSFLSENSTDLSSPTFFNQPQTGVNHWVYSGQKAFSVPSDLFVKVSHSVQIIDDSLFEAPLLSDSDTEYSEFRKFVSTSHSTPYWKGYAYDFAIKRDIYDSFVEYIYANLKHGEIKEELIILHGQTCVGKTITLGQLAYDMHKKFKLPCLFISRNQYGIKWDAVDDYLQWIETQTDSKTLIIWDGMIDSDSYLMLANRFFARGRKCVFVCSSYKDIKLSGKRVFKTFEMSPILTEAEVDELGNRLKCYFDINFDQLHFPDNLLPLLYRYLPVSRRKIVQGLFNEKNSFEKIIDVSLSTIITKESTLSNMQYAMIKAGLLDESTIDFDVDIDRQLPKKLFDYLTVVGQFGLAFPYELAFRCIGFNGDHFSLFKLLRDLDLIKTSYDNQGNLYLSLRNSFEASIFAKGLGGVSVQVELIINILNNCRLVGIFSEIDLNFSISFLEAIGPNSRFPDTIKPDFRSEYIKIINALRNIRNNQYLNPRLLVKESLFSRDYYYKHENEFDEDYLNELQSTLKSAVDNFSNPKSQFYNVLRIEYVTLKSSNFVNKLKEKSDKNIVKADFENIIETILNINPVIPSNYHALDVLAWLTIDVVQSKEFSKDEKLKYLLDTLNCFDLHESEGINPDQIDSFNERKITLLHLLETFESDDRLEIYKETHSNLYFYTFYRLKIKNVDLQSPSERDIVLIQTILEDMNKNDILSLNDNRLLGLYLKLFILAKFRKSISQLDKQFVSLNQYDWKKLIEVISMLENFNSDRPIHSLLYLKAVALFNLREFSSSIKIFKELEKISDLQPLGKRRVIKHLVYCDENREPFKFEGSISETRENFRTGEIDKVIIYVPNIRVSVPCFLKEFNIRNVQKHEKFLSFCIAFNYLGPIAIPVKQ